MTMRQKKKVWTLSYVTITTRTHGLFLSYPIHRVRKSFSALSWQKGNATRVIPISHCALSLWRHLRTSRPREANWLLLRKKKEKKKDGRPVPLCQEEGNTGRLSFTQNQRKGWDQVRCSGEQSVLLLVSCRTHVLEVSQGVKLDEKNAK